MTAVMLFVLLGLGSWQVKRLFWKEALLAQIAQAEAAEPIPLAELEAQRNAVAIHESLGHRHISAQ